VYLSEIASALLIVAMSFEFVFHLLLIGSGIVYIATILWLLAGMCRRAPSTTDRTPAVSVIVPARNEADCITDCLQALRQQDYTGPLEVIIVDDRSEDGTGDLVRAQMHDWPNLKLIRARNDLPLLCPKKSALMQGIEASTGELLVFTDADCQPPPGWVRSMVRCFTDDVGFVAGYASVRSGRLIRQKLVSLDHLVTVGAIGTGSFGMGNPLACTGQNLAYRRRVYDQVGGFTRIGNKVGGDDTHLMRLVSTETDWQMIFNDDPDADVTAQPAPRRWRDIIHQKLRHAGAAGHFGGPILVLAGMVYLFHLFLLIGLVRMAALLRWDTIFLTAWAARWLVDFAWLWRFAHRRSDRKLLVLLPLLEVCYIPYLLFFTVIGGLGGFRWKK